MVKNTKIVATIGPATETEEVLRQLIDAGMNVARFNTKHSDPQWHNDRIQRVQKVAEEMNHPVAVLLDLQGPEIRIDLPGGTSFDVAEGDIVTITTHTDVVGPNTIFAPVEVIKGLQPGSHILFEDGASEFEVVEQTETSLKAKAIVAATVKNRKTMNTPGVVLDMPSLTERDYGYLNGVDLTLVDYVGLSFVRNVEDIEILRKELSAKKSQASIVAKIENQAALDNLDEIIEASDAVMVARGDLGVEVAYQELIYWQRTIITKSRQAAKPVITATEMLKSMVEKPRPTRAEVSDVAHAIYDGTDAIMLSDETTIGKYPVKAVEVQAKIAEFNERYAVDEEIEFDPKTPTSAVSYSAMQLVRDADLPISKIVCLTETGLTARILASYHPDVPVHVLTSNHHTVRKAQLLYGVTAHLLEVLEGKALSNDDLLDHCKKAGIVEKGETILFIQGSIWKQPGLTNTVSIITIS